MQEPVAVFLTPTDNCNLVCRCPSPSLACRHFMDPALASQILTEVATDSLFHGRVTWSEFGEPFLHAENFAMLEQAKAVGLNVYFYSNLSLPSEPEIDRLARTLSAGDTICLNLEWGKRVYEQIRKNSPYEQKLANVYRLIEANRRKATDTRCRIEVWSINYDIVTEEDRSSYFRDMRAECATRGLVPEFDTDRGLELQRPDADVYFCERWESNWKDFKQLTGEATCAGTPAPQLHIHASGKVCICCHDWHAEACIGNVKRQSLREIWEGDARKDLYRSIEELRPEAKICQRCLGCSAPASTASADLQLS